ncbi:MAG TPA: peptide chain release factor N(5)-glutamine methyltransferase [Tenuifilaceae bacterium]|nr:peptide chain release factor N(5)-glutamine methyltransferase [Tenuifilaceae bacterium]
MNSYTLRQLFDIIGSSLSELYSATEVQAIRKLLFEKIVKMPEYRVHLNPNDLLSSEISNRILEILDELKKGNPVQYVIGDADFMDMVFEVNPSVLIPRPETEELVHWIISNNKGSSPKILDIGAGSGCIAISLAKYLSNAKVSALDVSENALSVARRNAIKNGVNVDFINGDILELSKIEGAPYDIIVSNPPYVRELEKQLMSRNVTDFEPHLALFVSDNDPLVFYRTIAQKSKNWLKPNGQIYFEINEAFGSEIKDMLIGIGFSDVEIRKDINGKDRMAFGRNFVI